MMEMKFNIKDATLLGSASSYNATTEVLNTFRVGFNKFKLKVDAYKACKSESACSKIVDTSNGEIL